MKIELYCICGEPLKVTVDRRKKQQTLIVWYTKHSGPGHADTTAAGAEQARRGYGFADGREFDKQQKGK